MSRKICLSFFGGLACLVVLSGCQARSTSADPASAFPQGTTVTVESTAGLVLSTWSPTGTVASSRIDLRLQLRNNSGRTLQWREFNFGFTAWTAQGRRGSSEYRQTGIGSGPQLEYGHSSRVKRVPLTLRPGEATSSVNSMALFQRGTWVVTGYAFPDDESLRTPTITVVVR